MPSSLVQRIRIRSKPRFYRVRSAQASSYPSRTVEANPANSAELAVEPPFRRCRHFGLCAPGTAAIPAGADGSRRMRLLVVLIDLRFFAQHRVQQRAVNLDRSLVIDEALLPELVHEEAHP